MLLSFLFSLVIISYLTKLDSMCNVKKLSVCQVYDEKSMVLMEEVVIDRELMD